MIPYAVRPSIFVAAKVLPSAEEPNILLQCHCLACKLHKDFCQVALCYFTTIFNTSGHSDWATLGMSIKEGEQKAIMLSTLMDLIEMESMWGAWVRAVCNETCECN